MHFSLDVFLILNCSLLIFIKFFLPAFLFDLMRLCTDCSLSCLACFWLCVSLLLESCSALLLACVCFVAESADSAKQLLDKPPTVKVCLDCQSSQSPSSCTSFPSFPNFPPCMLRHMCLAINLRCKLCKFQRATARYNFCSNRKQLGQQGPGRERRREAVGVGGRVPTHT